MKTPRWLITGANGFLGYRVAEQAAGRGEAFGLVRSVDRRVAEGVTPVLGDLDDVASLGRLVLMVRPQCVIHLAAMTKVDQCQTQPEVSLQRNVTATRQLAEHCQETGAHFVFASTDMVFSGESGGYDESSQPQPVNLYGMHKRLAEEAVMQVCPTATICRLPWMFGMPTPQYDGHFAGMVKMLMDDQPVRLFDDEFRTPLSTEQVANSLLHVSLDPPEPRLLHFAGPTQVNRYQIGCWAAESLKVPLELVVRCQQTDHSSPTPRPANVSLATRFPHCVPSLHGTDVEADIRDFALRIKQEIENPKSMNAGQSGTVDQGPCDHSEHAH